MTKLDVAVMLPNPHPKQADFIYHPAKRKVIVAGRRVGKTTGVSMLAVDKMLDGRRVLYAVPTQDQTDTFWDNCKRYFDEGIRQGVIYKNETKRILELPYARLRAKTAWDADTLRGDYADLLILDEYSLMDPTAWEEVGAPMLLDNDGDAIFIFTPKRKNHAFKLYQRAKADETGRWAYWHFTSFDNPYLSPEALEEITFDMTEEAYQQEIMAQFLEGEGQVFRNIDACLYPGNETPEMHKDHVTVMGVDWGKSQDYTAAGVGCATCKKEVAIDRFNKIDYGFQRDRLKRMFAKWNVKRILAESNAMGEPNIDELRRDGLPVVGFQTTAQTKQPLIQNLALVFENEEWKFIDNPVWTAEAEAYEQKISATTGRSTYSAPSGMNDDTVIERALMVKAADMPYGKETYAFI